MAKICAEEKAIYGVGRIDEGNWLVGQFTVAGESWGTVEMPLSFVPAILANRLRNGKPVHFRILISEDGERRVKQPVNGGPYNYEK